MASTVGVLVYNGYHELEFWYPVLRLREADVPVNVLGIEGDQAAHSILGYPVVPNAALAKTSPRDLAAIVIPGGNVGTIAKDSALQKFLADASSNGAILAAISQAGVLLPQANGAKTIVAKTSDELPQWSRKLLTALGART
jgi:protease I